MMKLMKPMLTYLVQDSDVTKLGSDLGHQGRIRVTTRRHLAVQDSLHQPAELHCVRGQHSLGVTLYQRRVLVHLWQHLF